STEKKKLEVGTEGTMFPWTYVEDDKIVGFEADIMAEISKRTGYEIEMKAMDWSGLFGNLDAKRVDTVANIVTITDE
ncbi:transporter substrate-binding domain-containing protein, partial [Eggerthella lenta]|uniref:transporter substrate-binding domain-containing protein n=2 Tax=Bacillati TaxID=1783272 RepID=UPI001D076C79